MKTRSSRILSHAQVSVVIHSDSPDVLLLLSFVTYFKLVHASPSNLASHAHIKRKLYKRSDMAHSFVVWLVLDSHLLLSFFLNFLVIGDSVFRRLLGVICSRIGTSLCTSLSGSLNNWLSLGLPEEALLLQTNGHGVIVALYGLSDVVDAHLVHIHVVEAAVSLEQLLSDDVVHGACAIIKRSRLHGWLDEGIPTKFL